MDNYYKQLADLLCARERLNTLRDRADEIFNRYFPITARYTEASTSGGGAKNDKMVSYLSELEESGIDNEIKNVIQKIEYRTIRCAEILVKIQSFFQLFRAPVVQWLGHLAYTQASI